MLSVVNIRGDRLYHGMVLTLPSLINIYLMRLHSEHIWWDQAGALLQAGILPTHVPHEKGVLRLPVSGVEAAQLLINENDGATNAMLGEGWGVKPS
jgi:carboxymethylenebutenolidase